MKFYYVARKLKKTPKNLKKLRLVANPVIEAIARLEFEDGLRTGVLPGGCWCPRHTEAASNTLANLWNHLDLKSAKSVTAAKAG